MKTTKTGKKAVFRMNTARSIVLGDIIIALNIKIGSVDEKSIRRELIKTNENLTQEDMSKKLMELDKQLETLNLYHDVLEIVNLHSKEYLRKFLLKEERTWQNEWDIPLEIFNEAIEGTIDILTWFQERGRKESLPKYRKEVAFLEELKAFRNQ